jgi:hypothetical protein
MEREEKAGENNKEWKWNSTNKMKLCTIKKQIDANTITE